MSLYMTQADPLLGIWKLEETEEELLAQLVYKADYIHFLERVSADKRRQEHLACRVLLKTLIGEEMHVAYRSSGAPYLLDKSLFVSMSHTKDYAAVILDAHPTGIDIEYRSDRVLKIQSRFMSLEEQKAIDLSHEAAHSLIYWCAKETLFKVIDQKEVDFQKHLHVEPFQYADAGSFIAWESRTERKLAYRVAYKVTDDFVLTWVEASL